MWGNPLGYGQLPLPCRSVDPLGSTTRFAASFKAAKSPLAHRSSSGSFQRRSRRPLARFQHVFRFLRGVNQTQTNPALLVEMVVLLTHFGIRASLRPKVSALYPLRVCV